MRWSRKAVAKGLKELKTGIIGLDHYQAPGRKKSEQQNPQLEEDILSLVDGKSYGLSFKTTQKTKALKKIPQTDAIFENVARAKKSSAENAKSLRISIDSKAKVKRGNFSPGGYERNRKAKETLDHDYPTKEVLVPFGILDVLKEQ